MIELLIIVVTLVAYVAIGAYTSRAVKNPEDFLIAGMKLAALPLFGTYLATYFSGVSMMGFPGDMYARGVAVLWLPVFWALGTVLLIIIALRFKAYSITTPAEFIRVRYGSRFLEILVGVSTVIALTFGLIVQFTVMGIAWSLAIGRPYHEGVIITAITIAIIIAAGGLVSVAWSDILKAAVFAVAIFVGGAWVLQHLGGPAAIISRVGELSPALLDPVGGYTLMGLVMLFFIWTFGVATHPQYLQRVTAGKDLRTVLLQYIPSWVILVFIYYFLLFMALGARVLMPKLPEGYTTDYALPLLLRDYSPTAIYGLYLAGLIAAALSTTDSVIQLAASTLLVDVVKPVKPDVSPKAMLGLARALSIILTVFVALLSITRPAPVLYLAGYAWGLLAVGYFAPVFFGLYLGKANKYGAVSSVVLGWIFFITAQSLAFARMWPYPVPPVALGVMAAIATHPLVSIVTARQRRT